MGEGRAGRAEGHAYHVQCQGRVSGAREEYAGRGSQMREKYPKLAASSNRARARPVFVPFAEGGFSGDGLRFTEEGRGLGGGRGAFPEDAP